MCGSGDLVLIVTMLNDSFYDQDHGRISKIEDSDSFMVKVNHSQKSR